jgi:nucleoside-diphosphate-sugar epimerase
MDERTVLITGASGFVGCRLAERLAFTEGYRVLAGLHRYGGTGVARLARLPIRMVLADMLDLQALTTAAKEADFIVNLAYGSGKAATVGTENVMKAAMAGQVRKVIHMSTAAVHGDSPEASFVTESSPLHTGGGNEYITSKIKAEAIVQRYILEHRLPAVILRPPLIYGPRGAAWTVQIIDEIRSGGVLVNGGNGAANLVFIDNLIDVILAAMETDAGDGEVFLVLDDERLTWKDVYREYSSMLGRHPPIRVLTTAEIEDIRRRQKPSMLYRWLLLPWAVAAEIARSAVRSDELRMRLLEIPWIRLGSDLTPKSTREAIKSLPSANGKSSASAAGGGIVQLPSPDRTRLYASEARFSNEKMKRLLGYSQRITFEEGMALTRSWLEYQRLIP